jgi:hypothetical protein
MHVRLVTRFAKWKKANSPVPLENEMIFELQNTAKQKLGKSMQVRSNTMICLRSKKTKKQLRWLLVQESDETKLLSKGPYNNWHEFIVKNQDWLKLGHKKCFFCQHWFYQATLHLYEWSMIVCNQSDGRGRHRNCSSRRETMIYVQWKWCVWFKELVYCTTHNPPWPATQESFTWFVRNEAS